LRRDLVVAALAGNFGKQKLIQQVRIQGSVGQVGARQRFRTENLARLRFEVFRIGLRRHRRIGGGEAGAAIMAGTGVRVCARSQHQEENDSRRGENWRET
jgi:hypothetical protein